MQITWRLSYLRLRDYIYNKNSKYAQYQPTISIGNGKIILPTSSSRRRSKLRRSPLISVFRGLRQLRDDERDPKFRLNNSTWRHIAIKWRKRWTHCWLKVVFNILEVIYIRRSFGGKLIPALNPSDSFIKSIFEQDSYFTKMRYNFEYAIFRCPLCVVNYFYEVFKCQMGSF